MGHKKGMILSEILLAGAIISVALASLVIVIGSLQSMVINSQNGFEAQLLAKKELSLVHMNSLDDVSAFEKTDGMYTTNFSVQNRNDFSVNVSADVSWHEGSFKKHRVFTDQLVDLSRAVGAVSCDWLDNAKGNLSEVDAIALNIDDGNPVTDVTALGDFVYVSADSATSSLPDLYVIDVRDIKNPNTVGRLNTGPGIASIVAVGNYVFVANAGSYQMQIIDVSDPANPRLLYQSKLPGAVISGSGGFGNSIHFSDNKIYIGLNKNAGPEFFVVDVTNPLSPAVLGSYEAGSTVNSIDVQGSRAVVADTGQNSILLLDISNPAVISEVSHGTFTGWQTQGAQSVEFLGRQIFLGRTLGGFYSPYPELMNFDRDNLSATTSSLKIGGSVDDVFAFRDYLYVASSNIDSAFQIFKTKVEGTTTNIVSVFSKPLPSRGVALTCNNKAMFVVTQDDRDFIHAFYLPQ